MREIEYQKASKTLLNKYSEDLQEYLLEFIQTTPLPMFLCDNKLKIITVNEEFLRKLKYQPEEIKNINLPDLFPDSYALVKQTVSRLNIQEKAEIKRVIFKNKLKKELTGTIIFNQIKKYDSEIIAGYIVKLEQRTDSLVKQSQSFDDFLNKLSQRGKWLFDPESRLFFGSTICFSLLGIPAKTNVVNFTVILRLLSSKEEKENLEKDFMRVMEYKTSMEREIKLKISNEKGEYVYRYFQLFFKPFTWQRKVYLAGTLNDISHFKKVERDLYRSRASIQKADQFKSVFLNNLSHEIRTPMNSIMGYSELLRQNNLDRSEIDNYTSIIQAKGNYLLALIDDVNELTRFENGNIEFTYTNFLLLPLLSELYKEFEQKRSDENKNNIELVLDIPPDASSQTIYTDYGRLQQILSNLLGNALKFTTKGKIAFGYEHSLKKFKFFVEDTGIGLTEEEQKLIFNRFEIMEETALKQLSGTGLSLTISKHIAEQLGGKIKVQSEKNHGSRFQLNIPALSPPDAVKTPLHHDDSGHAYNWKSKVILIAEDDEISFRFLEAILEKTQAKILRAVNGQEAVDLCEKINKINIVLMDLKLPVLNGYEATQIIKQKRPDLPIIAQTAFSSQKDILKSLQAGVNDFITKPLDIEALFEKMNHQFNA